MHITVNGKPVECEEQATLRQLLVQLEVNPQSVVVERNRELVLGAAFATTRLEEGDSLEVVHFVGGG